VIVIDSSLLLGAMMPDEGNVIAADILDQSHHRPFMVPPHFHLEVANALTINMRRKRIDIDSRADLLNSLNLLPCDIHPVVFISATALADQHDLTLYDAAYLALAQRLKYPLATLDRKLAAAAATLNLLHPAIASSWLSA
jgi:predicted nucleic acid-binding protein